MFSLLPIAATLLITTGWLAVGCAGSFPRSPNWAQGDDSLYQQAVRDTSAWNLPFFGFNTRGDQDPEIQVRLANNFLSQIDNDVVKRNLVIRVTGGTRSQTTYASDWTDRMISDWAQLQKTHGIRLVYVVNGNDTPANQAALIKRWQKAGAHFDFLEMMNEYYLPKYAKGDRSDPEVTQAITPEKYVDQILPDFWKELDQFNLPYYVIFAPTRPGRPAADQRLAQWNDVVANAVKNKYPKRQINATIHLYVRNGDELRNFDYDQIDRLRRSLPPGRHIAVTEAGALDPKLSYAQVADAATAHYRNILRHLRPGDYLLDQVLYAPNKRTTALLSGAINGETPKGAAMRRFIVERMR